MQKSHKHCQAVRGDYLASRQVLMYRNRTIRMAKGDVTQEITELVRMGKWECLTN